VFREMVQKRRPYRLGRREVSSRATRDRIVEATIGLHDEQGISSTTFRDVASRAGVSPATVLRHFPRMEELIRACGARSDELLPFPGPGVLAGATSARARLHRAVVAIFGWYEVVASGWEHLQIDRRRLPEVDAWLRRVDQEHRSLIGFAIGRDPRHERVAIVTALTSFGAWQSLIAAGHDSDGAARIVVRHVIGSGHEGDVS
jgi:AcrR family transcriptional regulator